MIGGPPVAQLSTDEVAIRLVKLAERLGVADRVQLLGRVPHRQLPKLMRSADASCAPLDTNRSESRHWKQWRAEFP